MVLYSKENKKLLRQFGIGALGRILRLCFDLGLFSFPVIVQFHARCYANFERNVLGAPGRRSVTTRQTIYFALGLNVSISELFGITDSDIKRCIQ
jgi:hypothetical protein